ncbi:ABC transporter permease [Litorilinea aerophila]|uniref:ABC transporter permease n=1 Tax=Litorilinea aerophila TaxID=1204385 RepID=A0A540VMC1_9CHLR|nr:ABC transporter permease [Litorilinea aerophila]MCC9074591.1 ABC transporter permease [Litorilinea aerophila]
MAGLTPAYVLRRVGMWLLTIWLGATIIFVIPRLAPGDPVAAMVSRLSAQSGYIENSAEMIEAWRERFGLNGPWYVQYLSYLRSVLTFDLGYSLASFPSQVRDMIAQAVPWTIGLLTLATLISFVLGNLIGALMAWRRTPRLVRSLLPVTLTFTSIPFFMLGILLIYVFAFGLRWFPPSGAYDSTLTVGWNWEFIVDVIHHGTLPALSIVVTSMGFWALGMRGMMITNEGEDYMILADAKGLSPRRVFWFYGVRNSVLPQVTALALNLGGIAGGSTLVEYIFAYPGMGYLLYLGIVNTDYTLIQGIVFMLIVGTATAVLILDLLYPLIDPRITYEKG